MTKTVRIENACMNTSVKLKVTTEVFDANITNAWVPSTDPEIILGVPTGQREVTLWSGKRIIIEEVI